jgi:hypothetical protein
MGAAASAERLIDLSAWARLDQPSVPRERAEEIAEFLEQGCVAVCLPFLLRPATQPRSGSEYAELLEELLALPLIPIDEDIERQRSAHNANSLASVITACDRST